MLDLGLVLFKQLVTMAIYMGLGYLLLKIKLISPEANKQITNLLMYVLSPMLILSLFNMEYDPEILKQFIICTVVSIGLFALSTVIALIAKIKGNKDIVPTEQFGIVFGNSGFIGTPLTIAVLGNVGGLYNTAYTVAFNIFNWTYGQIILGRAKPGRKIKDILKLFNNPFYYVLVIGMFMYITGLHFPSMVQDAINNVGNMMSPVAMMCSGMYIAQGDLLKGFKTPRVYFIVFVRLIIMPAIIIPIVALLHLDHVMAITLAIAAATPMAATTIFFSNDRMDRLQRSMDLFVVSLILCIFTLPVIVGYSSAFI